jgi:uncharacterized protein (TIGR02594 family)
MQSVRDVQIALKKRGYDIGMAGADGILGRATRLAIEKFQADKGLFVDGIAGTATLRLLFPTGSHNPESALLVPWYAEASRHLGLKEVGGKKHNPTILSWLERLKAAWQDDETAWCGTFVGWCIAATLSDEPLPANPFAARSWGKFGRSLERPAVGAVAVFWRGSPDGWQGHVGFIKSISPDGKALEIRGGNQGNMVRDDWFETKRLVDNGIRWPSTAPVSTGTRVPVSTIGGPLSKNEA